ncbi:MAG TPA: DUF4097 family beta strand repeat-containing protein [Nocardioidaceae bacterium]|nr:DUF4097 family beta strand repeat-containing protein [Nocardioidaceae bacterium]
MHRFTTTTPPRLTVEFRAGTVSIDTEDVEETTVELRGRPDDQATQALIADTVVEQRGDDVVVLVPKRSHGLFGSTPELRVDITAPHGSRLNVKSASADLSARGTYGESRVASGSGDISVERVTGSAHVRSGSGDVNLGAAGADLTVGTGSGDIHVGIADAAVSVQSGSGDVVIESVAGALRAQTGSGDIEVRRADDDVKAQTGSGDVAVRRVVRGRIRAKAASGDLHVGVADGIPAWLDVKTLTGGVSNDLAATEPVGAEQEHVRLELNTVSGDIDIVRA